MSIKSELENLCKQNGYKGISAEIQIESNGEDHDKNRLVAILCLNPGKGSMKDFKFVEGNDLIKNAFTSLEKEVASYSCKGKWSGKCLHNGQVREIFFLAKGWPKLKNKLGELGIKYKLENRLDPKKIGSGYNINDYLLPSSQKVFGFEPAKPKALTAQVIKQLAQQYNLGEVYVEIEYASHSEPDEDDKDKLAAVIYYSKHSVSIWKNPKIYEELFKPMVDALENVVGNNSHNKKSSTLHDGQVQGVSFMAKVWPKLQKKLEELSINYKLQDILDLKRINSDDDIDDYLTPDAQKIFGFKPAEPKVLTAQVIKRLVGKYDLKRVYVEIELVANQVPREADKDKLAALIYSDPPIDILKNRKVYETLFEPMADDLSDVIGNDFFNLAETSFAWKKGLAESVGFMAQGWSKLKKQLDKLGIKYKLSDKLDPKRIDPKLDIDDYLTPDAQKIFGFKPDMPEVLTAKSIKQLVQKYDLGEVYVIIEFGVHGDYIEDNKDKLAASICYRKTSIRVMKNPEIYDKLFKPMIYAIKNAIGSNSHNSAGTYFTAAPGRVYSIGFMAKGWPKLKQLLNALQIDFKIAQDLKKGKDHYFTPGGAKILGI